MTEIESMGGITYRVRTAYSEPARQGELLFVAPGAPTLAPSVEVEVVTISGLAWIGKFFGDGSDLTRIVAGLGPDVLVVVARGAAYVVPVERPERYFVPPANPVVLLRQSSAHRLLLLFDYASVVAVGAEGTVRWEAREVVVDGFAVAEVRSDELVVSGYVPWERREVTTAIDLATGSILRRD